jgi:hypothetical protein
LVIRLVLQRSLRSRRQPFRTVTVPERCADMTAGPLVRLVRPALQPCRCERVVDAVFARGGQVVGGAGQGRRSPQQPAEGLAPTRTSARADRGYALHERNQGLAVMDVGTGNPDGQGQTAPLGDQVDL